jgi:hypothetical protein
MMGKAAFSWLGLAVLVLASMALPAVPAACSGDRPDVMKLIRQLGSDEFDQREEAQRGLEALGEDDLSALRAAAKHSTDAEVRRRLKEVIAAVESRVTRDAYAFIEKIGGSVRAIEGGKPVKAGQAGEQELGVTLSGTKFGDADVCRLKWLGNVNLLILAETRVTDSGLRDLQTLPDLRRLCLDSTAVTDAGLAHLKPLKNLEALYLRDTKVKGKGLDHLKDLKELSLLALDGCDVGDDDLAHVVTLTHVTLLQLDRVKITDAGLARLTTMPELKSLYLEQTRVTDTGLPCLARIKKLEYLRLHDTRITAQGVTVFRKAHPGILVLEDVSGLYKKLTGSSQKPQR